MGERSLLVGRHTERSQIDALFADADSDRSRVLVLRGEPGVGKTALINYALRSTADLRVVQTVGVESEADLAFAALHQLSISSLDYLSRLPEPQREALEVAFGLKAGTSEDRLFMVGLATLTLFSAMASEQPLLCVVDDLQWVDRESARALAFVARRLMTEPIVILFATRDDNDDLQDLPELVVEGLGEADASELLSSVVSSPLNSTLRDRIIAETGGNPLALLELPKGLTAAELDLGFGSPSYVPLSRKIEETFGRRISGLPLETQQWLLLSAAGYLGDAATIWGAAENLGISENAAEAADAAGLLEVGSSVRFRHPLVRSAVYRSASSRMRRVAHQALADATDPETDPDRRAWHLAAATFQPDEAIAGELERSAGRAQRRSGSSAAAALLARSAELTPEVGRQALRRLSAAAAYLQSGSIDQAETALSLSRAHLSGAATQAQALRIEGGLRFVQGRGGETPTLLFRASMALRAVDHQLATEVMAEAWEAAIWAGYLTTGTTVADVAEAVRTWPDFKKDSSTAAVLLTGYSERLTAGYPACVAWWQQAVSQRADDVSGSTRLQLLSMLVSVAGDLLDFENLIAVSREQVRQAREEGALAALPIALVMSSYLDVLAGRIESAEASNEEAIGIARASGVPEFPGAHGIAQLGIMCWRGEDDGARRLAEEIVREGLQRDQGHTESLVDYTLGVLHLSYGRYEDARNRALAVYEKDPLFLCSMALTDLVEAAVRSHDAQSMTMALERLFERASASPTPWSLGLLARSRALAADDDTAEGFYLEAIEHLGRSGVTTDLARAHLLYGEWLRRRRRRSAAREQLRVAHKTFLDMGAAGFAQRTEMELEATGEHPRRRLEQRNHLTPQELQVAKMAAEGTSDRDIAAQLYISPHTVSYHLRKAYAKLGVRSRSHLPKALTQSMSH